MSLRLAGEQVGIQEKMKTLIYDWSSFSGDGTGDLEPATKTITATSEASGVGNADYSKALAMAAPNATYITIMRLCARLQTVIDSMTAGTLYCRVYVDAQDVSHRLLDLSHSSSGTKVNSVDLTSGTIFDLLKDGQSHTLYFFFWVNTGNAVLSQVFLWYGIGSNNTSEGIGSCMRILHEGLLDFNLQLRVIGSGTPQMRLQLGDGGNYWRHPIMVAAGNQTGSSTRSLVLVQNPYVQIKGSVADDLNHIAIIALTLRSLE